MKKKTRKINNTGYQFLRPLCKLFLIIIGLPKTVNKELVPKEDGFIFAGTHVSYMDPFLVGNTTPRSVHFLAKIELTQNKLLKPFMSLFGVIPVDRKLSKNPEAKQAAVEALKDGNIICVFPEGTRNRTDKPLMPFKFGAVSFAYKSGKPIVPFAITPKPKAFRRKQIIIGEPFYVKSADLEKENKKLEKIVLELLEKGK